ncbi:glucan 1,4-alpha-glucosidase [Haloarchaeobius sp. DFWS5]|uniref:glucan 1,4-alpha-glucosidase n=1 Tax=Haloarchaeobius sp. DFWS5 TaxID=3446114 RepID=UPI003EC14DBB
MQLRAALNDYKRTHGGQTVFPGECRTTSGLFSGLDARLVYVGADGRLRDFSAPLSGLHGLVRSRFGLRVDDETHWLDEFDTVSQQYHGDTALVETTFAGAGCRVVKTDLTIGRAHVTQVAVDGERASEIDELVVFATFAPEGTESQIGQLVYEDRGVVEAYHRRERNLLAADTGFDAVRGQRPEGLGELLGDDPIDHPRSVEDDSYEAGKLGGDLVAVAPFDDGAVTVSTLLAETGDERGAAVDEVAALAADHDAASLAVTANAQVGNGPTAMGTDDTDSAHETAIAADRRVLRLLASPDGPRIAGPDFDPFYEHSGGYGYTWFRDDGEISRYLLDADAALDLGLEEQFAASARFYRETQCDDGSWPHRVWPCDQSLAPGWANAMVEGGGVDYQADQTASVVAFLATYLRRGDPDDPEAIEEVLTDAVAALDDSLEADGLPGRCQNAWEDMAGRFTHTAATYLQAYASVAQAPVGDLAEHAAAQTRTVYDGIDDLRVTDRGVFALRIDDGEQDDRLDSSTFALAEAHAEAAEVGVVDEERLDRLTSHMETTLDGLYRETDSVAGLVRYEGDDWRQREQAAPKIWTVSTAWGAHAASAFADLLVEQGRDGSEFVDWADDLLAELLPGGSLCYPGDFLPEQVFDDGTPDSATPLGWPHAIRLAMVAEKTADQQTAATRSVSVANEDD